MHADSKKKDILILGKGPTDGLNYIILTAEAESTIIISELQNKFCLSTTTTEVTVICLLME